LQHLKKNANPISNNKAMKTIRFNFLLTAFILSLFLFSSCKKETTNQPKTKGIRSTINYDHLSDITPYKNLFLDNNGDSVVDLSIGNTRYKMFQALNYYLGGAIRDSKTLDALTMKNMFANNASPFTDVVSLNINGNALNSSGLQLRNITATTLNSGAEDERIKIDNLFSEMAQLSVFFADTAANGKPGKAGTYLANAKGIEIAQIIQKHMIGATQLDYISNVLLNTGLNADNTNIVMGKKHTALEQNWDEAYGFLTLNPVYLKGSTDAVRGTAETFLGSYIWEYNKTDYPKVYPAFLKGRAAIANNDINEMRVQAQIIRTTMEKAIANASVGYLNKWKTGTTDATRIHAIGEGLGFIYALRYCQLNGASAAFSDNILNNLISSPNGYWDLTAAKINAAANAINIQFNL
jgi:hypothetical protein